MMSHKLKAYSHYRQVRFKDRTVKLYLKDLRQSIVIKVIQRFIFSQRMLVATVLVLTLKETPILEKVNFLHTHLKRIKIVQTNNALNR